MITGLRFGTGVLQDNFVAELETHYDNYILSLFNNALVANEMEREEPVIHKVAYYSFSETLLHTPRFCR